MSRVAQVAVPQRDLHPRQPGAHPRAARAAGGCPFQQFLVRIGGQGRRLHPAHARLAARAGRRLLRQPGGRAAGEQVQQGRKCLRGIGHVAVDCIEVIERAPVVGNPGLPRHPAVALAGTQELGLAIVEREIDRRLVGLAGNVDQASRFEARVGDLPAHRRRGVEVGLRGLRKRAPLRLVHRLPERRVEQAVLARRLVEPAGIRQQFQHAGIARDGREDLLLRVAQIERRQHADHPLASGQHLRDRVRAARRRAQHDDAQRPDAGRRAPIPPDGRPAGRA
jgi:hypothetical protein